MPDQDIFNQQNPGTPPDVTDPFADKLAGIKNEQGLPKYKDVGTALDALASSQQFISQLLLEKKAKEEEAENLRKQLEQVGSIEDLIKRVAPPPTEPKPVVPTSPPAPAVVSEETIARTVQNALVQQQKAAAEEANMNSVIETVVKQFGDQAGAQIQKRAMELGTTTEHLRNLARTSPAMALELIVGKQARPNQTTPKGQVVPPHTVPDTNEYPKYERGVARGGLTNKELGERWAASKHYTNKRLGLDTN